MSKIGYARVSTREQNLDRQMEALRKAGCTKIFAEKLSGKNTDRPELHKMLGYVHDDDELVVVELSRLGRSSADLSNILAQLQTKNVLLTVLDLPAFNGVSDPALHRLLTNLTIQLMMYQAEQERKMTLERQRQGIAIAKRKGKYTGKRPEYAADAQDPHKRQVYMDAIRYLKARKGAEKPLSKSEIARRLGISRPTLIRIEHSGDAD
jgi:DNA invertase Pin-like site-specific DNA recombinase